MDFAQHRFTVSRIPLCSLWSSRCLSPALLYHLSPMENPLHGARTFGTSAPFLTSVPLLACSSPLHLSLSPSAAKRRQRNGEEERTKKKRPANTFGRQFVIFISESFAPFIRNPERTLQHSLFLSRAPSNPISLYFRGS